MTRKGARVGAGKSHLRERLLALGHAFEYLAAMGVFTVSRSRVFDKTMVISNRAPFRRAARSMAHSSSKNWLHETKFDLFELDE